jgi:pimeloyl-ACP methyl ester carboxylesterase
LSSPITWAPLFNDLRADPQLRERYQFWFYFYPTANPYLDTAADLRKNLTNLRQQVDPRKKDASFDQMVLVGHSMGGLISRLLTVDSRDDFWRQVSDRPFDQVRVQPETAAELQRVFFFEQETSVRRVIFLGTPHHGSKLSPSTLGRLAARLVQMPANLMKVAQDVAKDKTDLHLGRAEDGIPNSVDLLDPRSPALELLAARPRPANVRYHSIIGVVPADQAPVERWLSGTSNEVGDGVVSYASAHLEGVSSEVVVPSDHMHIHHHPLAVLEVRRILLEHLQSLQVIQPVSHTESGSR